MFAAKTTESTKGQVNYLELREELIPTIIAFHGYGQDAVRFSKISTSFPQHRFIAVDLPGHGQSTDQAISLKEWCTLIKKTGGEKFTVIAFSIGAAVALSLPEHLSGNIEKIILLAPSGIGNDKTFDFAVRTSLGRFLFKRYVAAGGVLNSALSFFSRLGLLPAASFQFLHERSNTREKRSLLYKRWNALRNLRISADRAVQIINKNKIPLIVAAGKTDPVIKVKDVKNFIEKIPHAKLILLDAGHRIYTEECMKEIVAQLS